jgi:glucose-1-phosphate cytidylyltransferase
MHAAKELREQIASYRHEDSGRCMDAVRDLRHLESLWDAGQAPWKTW